jgi:formylglycine-generating enzyme required for sulfatase activity
MKKNSMEQGHANILEIATSDIKRRAYIAAIFLIIVAGPSSLRYAEANTSGQIDKLEAIIQAPSDPEQWSLWREELARKREEVRKSIGYDDSPYRQQEFQWGQSCYSCCFAMMCDETFYERDRNQYTFESFINDGIERFGGYDAVVLWHAYPRIGFDDRNQFDFYRDMPGGLEGLKALSDGLHKRGVKVFIDYNPWDTGTRREGKSDADVLVELVKTIEADGIFLDTLHEGMEELRPRLDAVRPGVVLESELTLPVERIHDHHMSWAQDFKDSPAPGVLWNKWFERRHMMHQIQRWSPQHCGELHSAWMNGSGMLVWENVFGTWMGWNTRDQRLIRTMLPLQRRYVSLFCGEGWSPLIEAVKVDVYASLWEGGGLRLWTLVNRTDSLVEGLLLKVPHVEGERYFNLMTGKEYKNIDDGTVFIDGTINARGIGAIISGSGDALGRDFPKFLTRQANLQSSTDSDVNSLPLNETLRKIVPTKKYNKDLVPRGMALLPKASFNMEIKYRKRECGFYKVSGMDESIHPAQGLHEIAILNRDVELSAYAIDLTPVTNAEYAEFLKATDYKPKHPENFLKHWKNGTFPSGLGDHPVVYVDLDDARAYARWAGKRLPTEEERQYAAQGPNKQNYPWGNELKEGLCNDGRSGGTTSVTAFPEGRSGFGCYDMCGNVWEWTESERSDGRTRFCIIRGGSFYKAEGSKWYADGGPQTCNFAAKFLLMWPGLDRCATIGFRCAVDVAE